MSTTFLPLHRGIVHFYAKEYDKALFSFQKTLALDGVPTAAVYTWMGKCYYFKSSKTSIPLSFFHRALKENPQDIEANYWNGKTLSEKDPIQGFPFLVKAAKLSQSASKYQCCRDFFEKNHQVDFKKIRKLSSVDDAFKLLFSEYAYCRIEGLRFITKIKNSEIDSKKLLKIKQVVGELMGYNLCTIEIPFTGDRDPRVKEFALECHLHLESNN